MTGAPTRDPGSNGDGASAIRVFVSYSRRQSDLVDSLAAGLGFDSGFEVLIDRTALREGEAWRPRLSKLIAEAHAVILVLSRSFLESEICLWEAEEARRLNKRVIPVLTEDLGDLADSHWATAIHSVLLDREIVASPLRFIAGLTAVRRALVTDIGWLREHTRLLLRARDWRDSGHAANRLLAGRDIADAQAWLERSPVASPAATELHRDFIQASVEAEALRRSEERRRAERLAAALTRARVALVLTAVLAVAAGAAGLQAYRAGQRADRQRIAAQRTQGRLLAETAERTRRSGDAGLALLLALEALPDAGEPGRLRRPYVPSAEASLAASLLDLRELHVLFDPEGPIAAATLAADGRRALLASERSGVRVVEAETGRALERPVPAGTPFVRFAAANGSGRFVLSRADGGLEVWDLAAGEPVREPAADGPPASALALDPDGRVLALGRDNGEVLRVDVDDGAVLRLGRGDEPISSVAAGAGIVAAGSFDGAVHLFGPGTPPGGLRFPAHPVEVVGLALSEDGSRLLTTDGRGPARLWATGDGRPLGSFGEEATAVAFGPGGDALLTGSRDGTLRLWRPGTEEEPTLLAGHGGAVLAISVDPGSGRVLTTSADGTARLWEPRGGRILSRLAPQPAAVVGVAFAAEGPGFATAAADGTVTLWSRESLTPTGSLGPPHEEPRDVALSADGRVAATAHPGGAARLWELPSGRLLREVRHGGEVTAVALSADGRILVTGGRDAVAGVWSVESGDRLARLTDHPGPIADVDVTADGRSVAVASGSSGRVWSVSPAELRHKLIAHTGSVLVVDLSEDGRRLLTAGRDRKLLLWDLDAGGTAASFSGHAAPIHSAALSPRGDRVLGVGRDGEARVWDVATGGLVALLPGAGAHRRGAAGWSGDGTTVVLGAGEGDLLLWRTAPSTQALVLLARRLAPRCLTPEQRRRYLLDPALPRWCADGGALAGGGAARLRWPTE